LDLLEIHPSFWTREKAFTTWQFIRLNSDYKAWVRERDFDGAIDLIKASASPFGRYLENYPPKSPSQTFYDWYQYAVGQIPSKPEALNTHGRILHLMPGYKDNLPAMSRLPKNWPPVPHDCAFPHPWKLDMLTPTSIGCAVIIVPRNRRREVPFADLSSVIVGNTEYGVDLFHPDDQILAAILRDFPAVSKSGQTRIENNVNKQLGELRKAGEKKERDRETKTGKAIAAVTITAWQCYQIEKLSVIANATSERKDALLKASKPDVEVLRRVARRLRKKLLWGYVNKARVQLTGYYVEYAQKQIDASF
jgi:hypothetical protein